MAATSTAQYRLGDLLALARQSWLSEMSGRLASRGYPDYRRSDAAVIRIVGQQPVPIGRLGAALGISRQAARKVVAALETRELATVHKDSTDARSFLVVLTAAGRRYEKAIVEVIRELNTEAAAHTAPADLAAVDRVLRSLISGEHGQEIAARIAPP